jgi:ABC-2 type transport system permease protein
MEFRFDFTFRIIMDVVYYAVNITFFKLIYLHTPVLAGWTEQQMLIFVGAYLLVDAVNMTVFSTNMWWLPNYINRGDLDYYLIRPVSPMFFLTLKEFSANSFMNLLIAGSFLAYALWGHDFSIWQLVLFLLFLLNGAVLYACLQLLTIIPVFWTHSSRGFVDLFYALGVSMERPDRIYRGWLRIVFTSILPFSLVASFPARLFLEGMDWGVLAHLVLGTVCVWIVVAVFWKLGLRNYSSASS